MKELLQKYFKEGYVSFIMNSLESSNKFSLCTPLDLDQDQLLADEINSTISDYTAFVEKGDLTIVYTPFKNVEGKQYLRFGVLPQNEESFNYLREENEIGVSVFDLVDGKPALTNMQLVDSFSGRSQMAAFIVTGDQIGIGEDGEPLLKNVSYISRATIDIESITLDVLKEKFQTITTNDIESKEIHSFWQGGKWVHTYGKFEFSNPVSDFNERTGNDR